MQVYVQKLIRTTFPRSAFVLSAPELSQPTAPPKSGMDDGRWLCEKSNTPTNPAAMAKMPILMLMMLPLSCPLVAFHELLAAVDVVGAACERRVRHEVHGERGDVRRANDTPDRQRRPKLLSARGQLIAQQRCRKRRVHEPGCDEVDADGCEFEREVFCQGRKRGGESRDQGQSRRRPAATSAAHEEQRSSRANLARGVLSDPQGQQEMCLDVAAYLVEVHLRQRRVVRAGARYQHVINRRGQLAEELPEPFEIGGVKSHGAKCVEFVGGVLEALGIPGGEDEPGSLSVCSPGRFETDAGATADHDDYLAAEFRLVRDG